MPLNLLQHGGKRRLADVTFRHGRRNWRRQVNGRGRIGSYALVEHIRGAVQVVDGLLVALGGKSENI